jgi:hypothetical protein
MARDVGTPHLALTALPMAMRAFGIGMRCEPAARVAGAHQRGGDAGDARSITRRWHGRNAPALPMAMRASGARR